MKNILLLAMGSILLLAGCSGNLSGEKRGFVYRAHGGEFICSHEPFKADIKIEKDTLKKLADAGEMTFNLKSVTPGSGKGNATSGEFPKAKELVTYCQKLIDQESIQ